MARLVRVYASADPVEGDLMRARLETEGIPVLAKRGGVGEPYATGPLYLWVPEEHEVAARSVIDAVGVGVFGVSDEELEAQALAAEDDPA